ncbi:MAG: TetR/AcrR family transcriptional regulator [Thermoguttaceae bacterium]
MTTFQDIIDNQFGEKMWRPFCLAKRLAKRNAILAAATKVFAEKGYYTSDVQDIADIANVSKGTIYSYFNNKDYLFWALSIWAGEGLCKLTTPIMESETDSVTRLERLADAWACFFDNNPSFVELFLQQRAFSQSSMPPEFLYITKEQYFDPFYFTVKEGKARKEMVVKNAIDAAYSLSMSVAGALITHKFIILSEVPMKKHINNLFMPILKDIVPEKYFASKLESETRWRQQFKKIH